MDSGKIRARVLDISEFQCKTNHADQHDAHVNAWTVSDYEAPQLSDSVIVEFAPRYRDDWTYWDLLEASKV